MIFEVCTQLRRPTVAELTGRSFSIDSAHGKGMTTRRGAIRFLSFMAE
jgi:hypothetical protein